MFSFISIPILPSLRPLPNSTTISMPAALNIRAAARKSSPSPSSRVNGRNNSYQSKISSSKPFTITASNTNSSRRRSRHNNIRKAKSRRSKIIDGVNVDKWERVQPELPNEQQRQLEQQQIFRRVNNLKPENCPALVLNADFSPLSYMPLSLWPWQDVVKAVFLDRVTVVATYDIGVRSPGMIFPLPSVISLKQYQPMAVKKPAFTRFNVFMRDNFSCQYCGKQYPTQELTFDHVVPRCNNGKTNWTNVVTACIRCNHRKGRYMLSELKDMKLMKAPVEPSNALLQNNAKKFPPRYLHESWRDYVYWSQSMEEEHDSKSPADKNE